MRTRRVTRRTPVRSNREAGVCRGAGVYRYILGCVSVCGFVTTLSGGLCGSGNMGGVSHL